MNWLELKEDSMLAGASPKVAARARFVGYWQLWRACAMCLAVQIVFDCGPLHRLDQFGDVTLHYD